MQSIQRSAASLSCPTTYSPSHPQFPNDAPCVRLSIFLDHLPHDNNYAVHGGTTECWLNPVCILKPLAANLDPECGVMLVLYLGVLDNHITIRQITC